eukprot:gene13878-13997_t
MGARQTKLPASHVDVLQGGLADRVESFKGATLKFKALLHKPRPLKDTGVGTAVYAATLDEQSVAVKVLKAMDSSQETVVDLQAELSIATKAKLGDLGSARADCVTLPRRLHDGKLLRDVDQKGTPGFSMPLEQSGDVNTSADIWAFGNLLKELMEAGSEDGASPLAAFPAAPGVERLVAACMDSDVQKRPSAEMVCLSLFKLVKQVEEAQSSSQCNWQSIDLEDDVLRPTPREKNHPYMRAGFDKLAKASRLSSARKDTTYKWLAFLIMCARVHGFLSAFMQLNLVATVIPVLLVVGLSLLATYISGRHHYLWLKFEDGIAWFGLALQGSSCQEPLVQGSEVQMLSEYGLLVEVLQAYLDMFPGGRVLENVSGFSHPGPITI